jgi:exosome complex component RRP40
MKIVFPGELLEMETKKIGPGFSQVDDKVRAIKCGIVEQLKSTVYVDNKQKRYLPQLGEPVVGIIISKYAEFYRVDFGGPFFGRLDTCAFEGASRRNKPNLAVGTLVHGRVSQSNRDMEPEMECIGISGKKEGFGELKDGHLIVVSLQMARRYTIFDVVC